MSKLKAKPKPKPKIKTNCENLNEIPEKIASLRKARNNIQNKISNLENKYRYCQTKEDCEILQFLKKDWTKTRYSDSQYTKVFGDVTLNADINNKRLTIEHIHIGKRIPKNAIDLTDLMTDMINDYGNYEFRTVSQLEEKIALLLKAIEGRTDATMTITIRLINLSPKMLKNKYYMNDLYLNVGEDIEAGDYRDYTTITLDKGS